ncbi:FHA domain-containing protein [Kitasatospora purpeofusca]|uniref:FHA domain-containing protein n=1 Tax=Kitasatospora purpeofusca TaxID=67352 RepID=UPI002E1409E8|nr:FHA domain-containing protein [Kitasatospora purpeofusca]
MEHGIDRNLATSADRADYLVELSNIVRRTDFGGPAPRSLHRLGLVVDALVRLTGDRDVAVYCVADRSLLGGRREFTEPGDAPTLARWVAEGLVEEVPDADERVLEIAGMTGIQVVTGDYYDDHRIEHPWIQGNTWQFLRPEPVGRGVVRLAPLDMGHRTGAEISKKMELSALKKQGLLTAARKPLVEVVGRAWRCPDARCSLYSVHRGGRVMLPRMRGGVPTCELHGTPLLDDGARPGAAQVKLVLDGECVGRYTLDEGARTEVGRAPGTADGIGLAGLLPAERAARVSRRHLLLAVRGGAVVVRDTSTYGSRIRVAGRRGHLGPWEPFAAAGTDRPFRPGDEVELTPGLVLTRSGRRFPAELAGAWRAEGARTPLPPGAAEPTRSL